MIFLAAVSFMIIARQNPGSIFQILHISRNKPLNILPSSITIMAFMPKLSRTESIYVFASDSAVMSKVIVLTTNWVRLQRALSRYPFSDFWFVSVPPGDHKSMCLIQNGDVTGHEK